MPMSRSSFVRLSYSMDEYDAYRFVTQHANFDDMNFDNRTASFNLGVGVRF